ncbi:translation initiation factor 2 [Pseudomonas abietaniphila]
MNSLRCTALLLVALLSACDAEKPPAPAPKVLAVAPVAAPESKAVQAPEPIEKAAAVMPPVHELAPSVPTVRVTAASKPEPVKPETAQKAAAPGKAAAVEQKAPGANARSAKVKADNAAIADRAPVASKSKSPAQVVKETKIPKASLDLSLPPEMVKQMTPPPNVITAVPKSKAPAAGAKPLLPKMFPDTSSDPDFQLQGRLLSNEMQLQLRNEARKDVEGAAVDFTFKQ